MFNPPTLVPAVGFTHALIAAPGKTIYLGGQAGVDAEGRVVGPGLTQQFDAAAENVIIALEAAGAHPEHLVSMQIFTTDAEEYRRSLEELGKLYRKHFGKHYPALALFEVTALFDPEAKVELLCIAVTPDGYR
jgi:enamine deaminase RidA (YjgF/YER057c/UK114 family)